MSDDDRGYQNPTANQWNLHPDTVVPSLENALNWFFEIASSPTVRVPDPTSVATIVRHLFLKLVGKSKTFPFRASLLKISDSPHWITIAPILKKIISDFQQIF